jgi:hypothetical protein
MKSQTKTPSKFDAIFERKREEARGTEVSQAPGTVPDKEERKGPGRPRGKRSSPQYDQVTAYIPHALHDEVKIFLIREGRKEFSTLVEELLAAWVQQKNNAMSSDRGRRQEITM